MLELPLILLAGLMGSGHCLGMCGPFVLTIGTQSPASRRALWRQAAFTAGRLSTYGFLGGVSGAAGLWLTHHSGSLLGASGLLAVLAGGLLIVQGLLAAGWIGWPSRQAPAALCLAARAYASLLTSPRSGPVFLAGLLTGFLPCGLLYGFLALAATTHSVGRGAMIMATFGLGTAPALLIAGVGSSLASSLVRRRLLKLAAWSIVITGAITVTRGVTAIAAHHDARQATEACPFCRQNHSSHGATQRDLRESN